MFLLILCTIYPKKTRLSLPNNQNQIHSSYFHIFAGIRKQKEDRQSKVAQNWLIVYRTLTADRINIHSVVVAEISFCFSISLALADPRL